MRLVEVRRAATPLSPTMADGQLRKKERRAVQSIEESCRRLSLRVGPRSPEWKILFRERPANPFRGQDVGACALRRLFVAPSPADRRRPRPY